MNRSIRARCRLGACDRPVLAGWLVVLTFFSSVAAWGGAADLSEQVRVAISGFELSESTIGLCAIDMATDEVLAEINPELPMIPASNLKLFTTGAALVVLGPDFAFETVIRRDGRRLSIVGSGDPALADPEMLYSRDMDVGQFLDQLAKDIAAAGVTEIDELIIDDRVFDDQRGHPGWPQDQYHRSYCAEVSGFNFFLNCLGFYARPGSAENAAAPFRIEPDVSRWIRVSNQLRTTMKAQANNAWWVSRPRTENRFSLHGRVRFAQQARVLVSIHDPAEFFARVLAEALRSKGITVGLARSIGPDDPESEGELIARVMRTPMTDLLVRCNRDSENLYAEAMLKRIGHDVTGQRGSWANGAAIVRMVLSKRLGPEYSTQIVMDDGSGLSRGNRVSPSLMAHWLEMLYEDPDLSPLFVESLAVAGESGTMRRRFADVEVQGTVHAKSGYIKGVSCLSGYVLGESGRAVAFSILVNDIPEGGASPIPISRVKQLQERIVALFDDYLVGQERESSVVVSADPDSGDRAEESDDGGRYEPMWIENDR